MISNIIRNYYLLCSVSTGKSEHISSQIKDIEIRRSLAPKKNYLFIKSIYDNKQVVNESIIGGSSLREEPQLDSPLQEESQKSYKVLVY